MFVLEWLKEGMVPGAVVNVSNVTSRNFAMKGRLLYDTNKAVMVLARKVMVLELGPHKIRINAINPALVWADIDWVHWSDPDKVKSFTIRIPISW